MNVYDIMEAKLSQLAAIISVVTGLVQVICSSWVLERVLQSESLAYYSYGLRVGELKLSEGTRAHAEAYDLLTSSLGPFLLILKLAVSLGIISGLIQIGSSIILWKLKNEETSANRFRLWLGGTVVSFLLMLCAIILPIAYNVTHSIQIKIFIVITSLNIFLQAHLITVVIIQFRQFLRRGGATSTALEEQNPSSSATVPQNSIQTTSNPSPSTRSSTPAENQSNSASTQRQRRS